MDTPTTEVCIATHPAPKVLRIRWQIRGAFASLLLFSGVLTGVVLAPLVWYWWLLAAGFTAVAAYSAYAAVRCYLRWKQGFILKQTFRASRSISLITYYDAAKPAYPLGCERVKNKT